jgi:hypothetical protein
LWRVDHPAFEAPRESYPQIFTQSDGVVEKSSSFCGKLVESSPISDVHHSSGIAGSKSNRIGVSLAYFCNNRGNRSYQAISVELPLD